MQIFLIKPVFSQTRMLPAEVLLTYRRNNKVIGKIILESEHMSAVETG